MANTSPPSAWASSRSRTARRPAPCARHPRVSHGPLLPAARKPRGLRTATSCGRVGTPTLRPEDVSRLARAYYHADPQVIDETSVRGEDGRWHERDPRMQRVADALTRAELTQCAHRNRPLRYDGRVVVTLCAEDMLYLPVTTEISSLPQLTPEGLPLALARRAAEDTRMAKAVADLEERGEAVTARALAAAAHISLNTACSWLR